MPVIPFTSIFISKKNRLSHFIKTVILLLLYKTLSVQTPVTLDHLDALETTYSPSPRSNLFIPDLIKMSFKRRSTHILNQDSKSSAPPEFLEISDTESNHQSPSKATQQEHQPSSTPKPSGKTDFCFNNIKLVWKAYERLKRSNASVSVLRTCLKDNGFLTEASLMQRYS